MDQIYLLIWSIGSLRFYRNLGNWLGFKTLTLTLIIQCDAMEVGENQIELKFYIKEELIIIFIINI